MAHVILSDAAVSVEKFKRDPMNVVAAGKGLPVAILNGNEPVFYCIPAKTYEALMDHLEDLELSVIVNARRGQKTVRVTLDEL